MLACLVLHEATAIWDVRYAATTRRIAPIEQHIHGVLEMMPLTAILLVAALHWPAVTGLFGDDPDWGLRWRAAPLPVAYVATMLSITALFELAPYLEELLRTLRVSRWTTAARVPSATASKARPVRR